MSQPSAEFQVDFLDYIQTLLDGGSFVATYKYALLMALADLSVEKGADNNSPLVLHARDVAGKFIGYYSRQARPLVGADATMEAVLHQNTGRQASVVQQVCEAVPSYRAGSVRVLDSVLQRDKNLLGRVTTTVATMPLWKLQTIGGEVRDFLYENVGTGRQFTLRPGIGFCFRKFHGFTHRMAQDSWVRFVRGLRQNHRILGETADLATFMFGADRTSLAPYRDILADIQGRRCFYCDTSKGVDQVDHFIPWSWYSVDLGHNFVLACRRCNGAKSNMLAAPEHLNRWLGRNGASGQVLREYFDGNRLPYDLGSSLLIAKWAYGRVAGSAGYTWVRGKKDVEKISVAKGWVFPG